MASWGVRHAVPACLAATLVFASCAHAGPEPEPAAPDNAPTQSAQGMSQSGQPVNPSAQSMSLMLQRINEYVALHNKLEATLPKLPNDATPEQIDQNQRALGKLIQGARSNAKPGDIFTADAKAVILKLMNDVFGGPEGKQLKASIMDENPGKLQVTVNSRYPDTVPLSTVPPQVLAGLPRLPDDLEYRFIGRRLILLDVHAHIIADFIDNAIPV
jgi:hypothetical protein